MIATETNPTRPTDATEPADSTDSATADEHSSREEAEPERRKRSFSLRALLPGPYVRYPK